MAAMRRGSETGLMLTLALVFLVIALVGAGCGIFFFQQYRTVRRAVDANQADFRQHVEAVFTENNWDLPAEPVDEMGFTYKANAYQEVAARLQVAARHDNELMPLLGWASLEGLRDALEDSPRQRQLRAEEQSPYETLSGLLTFYEDRYTDLLDEVASLRADNQDLVDRLDESERSLVETQERLGERLNEAVAQFRSDLETLRADYEDLMEETTSQREAATEWRERYQEELDQRRRMVGELEREMQSWKDRYWDAVAPDVPDVIEAEGRVISVRTDTRSVFIEGGQDREYRETDRMIVFGRGPNGEVFKKGTIRLSEIHSLTSRASIVEEVRYIVEGDEFVTSEVWDRYQGS